MEIFLIRHTTVQAAPGLCYGHLDVPLAETFAQEARHVSALISPLMPMPLFSSPLSRCRLLAESLGPANLSVDQRLLEMHFGDWEGRLWSELDESEARRWADDFVNRSCPGGESYRMLYERVRSFCEDVKNDRHERIGVITHGGFIRACVAYYLDLPLERCFDLAIPFGHVIRLDTCSKQMQALSAPSPQD
jgi:alpha-ribazole phosphatase